MHRAGLLYMLERAGFPASPVDQVPLSEAGPRHISSQFGVSLKPLDWLEPSRNQRNAVFGRVTTGLSAFESMSPQDPPHASAREPWKIFQCGVCAAADQPAPPTPVPQPAEGQVRVRVHVPNTFIGKVIGAKGSGVTVHDFLDLQDIHV